MFTSWLTITLSLLILLFWTLSAMHLVLLFWEDIFIELLVPLLIWYQFLLKKGMEHFPRKRMKTYFDSIIRTNYFVDASSLGNT